MGCAFALSGVAFPKSKRFQFQSCFTELFDSLSCHIMSGFCAYSGGNDTMKSMQSLCMTSKVGTQMNISMTAAPFCKGA